MEKKNCIKGALIISAKKFLIKEFGPDAIDKIIKQLDAHNAKLLTEPMLTSSWRPIETYVRLLEVADRIFGNGNYQLCRKMGYCLAKEVIPKLYQIFIRFGNISFLIENAPRFWKQIVKSGSLEAVAINKNSGTVRVFDIAFPHKAFCFALMGYIQVTLELSGAKNISIKEVQCIKEEAAHCEYFCEWE